MNKFLILCCGFCHVIVSITMKMQHVCVAEPDELINNKNIILLKIRNSF